MKPLLKYIFLLMLLFCMSSHSYAKKTQRKKAKTSFVKKTNNQQHSKKGKSKKSKTVNKKIVTNKANLTELLKETTVAVEPSKADSVPEKVITILSAFKPQLRNLAKIGFVNATAITDTNDIVLNYQVPSQNLSFQYRPIALVPRSIRIDSLVSLKNVSSLKVGYGNYLHQYINLNVNTTDQWNNSHSIAVYNESYTGTDNHLQKQRDIGARYIGDQYLNASNSLQTQVFYQHSQRYRYGLVPDASNLPESNYEHNFSHYGASVGWLNFNTKFKLINLNPIAKIEQFEGIPDATDTWLEIKNPMYLMFKNNTKLNLDLLYSFNQYNPSGLIHQKNTILKFDPSITIEKWGSKITVGASPVWINKDDYQFLPNVHFQKKLTDSNYLVKVGWSSSFNNNHYASLAIQNPWIMPVSEMKITTVDKKYINLEVSADKRLDYSFGISFNDYKNLPFFNRILGTDVTSAGLKYQAIFESKATTIEMDANLRYQFSDRLLFVNKLTYKQFNLIKDNSKPWGVLPIEFNSNLNWLPNEKWILDASLIYWSGAAQFKEPNKAYNLKNTMVLNAGFTYKLTSNWSIWGKAENLLDKPYERWADYPSLGLQIIAGVVYSFRK